MQCTRRVVLAGGLAHLLGSLSGVAASPAVYEWQPPASRTGAGISFVDHRGRPITLASFEGRPVLLNIWATWCPPCVLEIPALDRLQRAWKDRLTVLAVSVDRSGMPTVLKAMRRLRLHHLDPYVDSSGELVSRLKLAGLPATLAISPKGDILGLRRGRVEWDDPAERQRLRAILGF